MKLPPFFEYRAGQLWLEGCDLRGLATRYGTPLYVYSEGAIKAAFERYQSAFAVAGLDALVCYAVKANSNLHLLRRLGEWGAGADVVSGGEIYRARKAGIPASKMVFAGVGKTASEIDYALSEGVLAFNVESAGELDLIEQRTEASGKREVGISLRVRPDVAVDTHHYISTGAEDSKFGMSSAEALRLARRVANSPHLKLRGLHVHIGSQLWQVGASLEAARRVLALASELKADGIELDYLDLGGGLGVNYAGAENEPEGPEQLAAGLTQLFREAGQRYPLVVEPGRFMVGMAGTLLTRLLYIKDETARFAVVDAGMNDLLRPALYGAQHPIVGLQQAAPDAGTLQYNVVGPVCESADFLGQQVPLAGLTPGAYLAVLGAGAYGFSMASNYNSRLRPAEVLVSGDTAHLIRRRETYADLVAPEIFEREE